MRRALIWPLSEERKAPGAGIDKAPLSAEFLGTFLASAGISPGPGVSSPVAPAPSCLLPRVQLYGAGSASSWAH